MKHIYVKQVVLSTNKTKMMTFSTLYGKLWVVDYKLYIYLVELNDMNALFFIIHPSQIISQVKSESALKVYGIWGEQLL